MELNNWKHISIPFFNYKGDDGRERGEGKSGRSLEQGQGGEKIIEVKKEN